MFYEEVGSIVDQTDFPFPANKKKFGDFCSRLLTFL